MLLNAFTEPSGFFSSQTDPTSTPFVCDQPSTRVARTAALRGAPWVSSDTSPTGMNPSPSVTVRFRMGKRAAPSTGTAATSAAAPPAIAAIHFKKTRRGSPRAMCSLTSILFCSSLSEHLLPKGTRPEGVRSSRYTLLWLTGMTAHQLFAGPRVLFYDTRNSLRLQGVSLTVGIGFAYGGNE